MVSKLPAFASSATMEEEAEEEEVEVYSRASSINEQCSLKPEAPPAMLSLSPSSGWQGIPWPCHCCPGCHGELAAAWPLAGDPGGLPPVALPDAFPWHPCRRQLVADTLPWLPSGVQAVGSLVADGFPATLVILVSRHVCVAEPSWPLWSWLLWNLPNSRTSASASSFKNKSLESLCPQYLQLLALEPQPGIATPSEIKVKGSVGPYVCADPVWFVLLYCCLITLFLG